MAKALADTLLRQPARKTDYSDYRQEAFRLFRQLGLPHRRMDQWKYVNTDFLLEQRLYFKKQKRALQFHFASPMLELHYNAAPLAMSQLPSDFSVQEVDETLFNESQLEEEGNVYALINSFTFEQAYRIQLQQHKLCVKLHAQQEEYLAPRFFFELAEGQQSCVLIDSSQLAQDAYCNAHFNFNLGENSQLLVIDYGGAAHQALQTTTLHYKLAAGAKLQTLTFSSESQFFIHDTHVDLAGEGASADLGGLALLHDEQKLHLHTTVNHLVENTSSRQMFKNVLFNRAKAEFNGMIYVAPLADGTDANQQNRNLLLSKWAHALARPQLNINAEDLQCGHGSTTGSLALEEVFYLQSRGISPLEARVLLTESFCQEVLQRLPSDCPQPDFKTHIAAIMAKEKLSL